MVSTSADSVPVATHLPFLVDDGLKELKSHMASANSHWKGLAGKNVLVVFQGPAHYISPEWYGEKMQVPTWNYAIVHVRGTFEVIEGETGKMALLDEMVTHFESSLGKEWSVDWNRKEYAAMLQGIVAFRISVQSVEGKWKLSQNHPRHAVSRAADELHRVGSANSIEVGRMMREAIEE